MKDYTYAGQSQSFDDKQVAVFFFLFTPLQEPIFVIHGWPFPPETDSVGWANQNRRRTVLARMIGRFEKNWSGFQRRVFPELWDGVWSVHLTALSKICDFHYSFLAARLLLHMLPAAKEVLRSATTLRRTSNFRTDLGGGCRGCAPLPPTPWDDLRLCTVIRQKKKEKKNFVVYWCWNKIWDEVEEFMLNTVI